MRVARHRLLFHALCVLDDAQERARHGPVLASPALRLALAILHLHGAQRSFINDLWEALVRRSETGGGADAFGRSQQITAAINGISLQVGVDRSLAYLEALRAARSTEK